MTQENCGRIGGNLYNLKFEQKCIDEIAGVEQYTIDVLQANAYVWLGVSCEILSLLRSIEQDVNWGSLDHCPLTLTGQWVPTKSAHDYEIHGRRGLEGKRRYFRNIKELNNFVV